MDISKYNPEGLRSAAPMVFAVARSERGITGMRRRLRALAEQMENDTFYDHGSFRQGSIIRVRDCARTFRSLLNKRSEDLAEFSVAKAIRDIASDRPRPDLSPAFFAEMFHLLLGLQGYGPGKAPADEDLEISDLSGRDAALERSRQLDVLWEHIDKRVNAYPHGLLDEVTAYREERKRKILENLGGSEEMWSNWKWQVRNIIRDDETLDRLLVLRGDEKEAVKEALRSGVPFGITPYYLSLMHDEATSKDRALRAQVIPPLDYIRTVTAGRNEKCCEMDFMLERDTSPIDLITRRYPGIVIFKPYNTCPQICVYCQRNWEIDHVMSPAAMARSDQIADAIRWIRQHPAIHEVLLTGGDPLIMPDAKLAEILEQIADISSIERIRIGSRTLVTLPMRITTELAHLLGSFREPGKREIALVTHVQHPYEITPDLVRATERISSEGIPIYNQLVYTFFVSRRFEAAALRRALRLAGIAPYYTFNMKGKEETRGYRVPIARLLQEQKEEARLFPGMARTDEAVYNVPGMGKNYLRARQNRSLLSIHPDGARVYEYHPWEKNISGTGPLETFITKDVPTLEYLEHLERIGERVEDYQTIWYYF